ncbi:MAG: CHAT domain-containing protein, partial [bacterium]|nr:CHAT domain-containing protein [bacterium]
MAVEFDVVIRKLPDDERFEIKWIEPATGTVKSFKTQTPDEERIYKENLWHDSARAKKTGTALFHFLDGKGGHFKNALAKAASKKTPLHLGISTCPESHDWPLELVAYKKNFLLRNTCRLVRKISGPDETDAIILTPDISTPAKRPLKLLFMAGSPMDMDPLLNFEAEEEAIFNITGDKAVELEVEDSGTLEGLAERLKHERFDVVHLSGHADVSPDGLPYFILEDETGRRRDVGCEELWHEALVYNPPHLLFLSGCRTGDTGETGVASFGRLMVEDFSVPAVLGWGRSVQDEQATPAAESIYSQLSRGGTLAEAVHLARLEAMKRDKGQADQAWHLLRLFCKGNGNMALVKKNQKATRTPRKLTHTYLKNSRVKILEEGFVGRRRELQQCVRTLKEKNGKIGVLLQGTAGLGKSCLAGKICQRFATYQPVIIHGILNDAALQTAMETAFTSAGEALEIIRERLPMTEKLETLGAVSFNNKKILFVLNDSETNLERKKTTGAGKTPVPPYGVKTAAADLLTVLLSPEAFGRMRMIVTCRYDFSLT